MMMSRVVIVPMNAINTKGTVSKRWAAMELPIVLSHKNLPSVLFLILSISQELDNSPRRNPVNDAMTILGT